MKIVIASYHAGYELKSTIISHLFLQDIEIVDTFLNAQFEGGRHEKRVCKISIPY
jgi:ribose 5-phosphate isomerase RpiB